MPVSLYTVAAVIVLDAQGERILAKYYPKSGSSFATLKQQQAFERRLFERTRKTPNSTGLFLLLGLDEVALVEGLVAVFRTNLDCFFYVVGTLKQNEVLLATVLDACMDTLSSLFKPQLDKRTFLENFDAACLALDEIVDQGIVLETDSKAVEHKVAKPSHSLADIQLNEQTFSSALQLAKEQVRSFLKQ